MKDCNWVGGKVVCDLCGHSWIAVFNTRLEKLEYPNCRNMSYFKLVQTISPNS